MRRFHIPLLLVLILIAGCQHREKAEFNSPQSLSDGWHVSSAEKEGFDQGTFEQLICNIPLENPKLDGIVVARNNKLIADQYFNGYDAEKLHKIWSITKAVSTTILGIARDNSLLSVSDSIYKSLGSYIADSASGLKAITIEHLITMTSGFEYVELGGPNSAGFKLPYSEDWVKYTLSLPISDLPGTKYNYCSGNSMLLAPILLNATGQQAKEYAKNNLFAPLRITQFEWDSQSEFWTKTQGGELPGLKPPSNISYKLPFADLTNTATGLWLRPRDMCKIGQLYLNEGSWEEEQIVSKEWINASTQAHFGNAEYGYSWRLMTFQDQPCYYATGFGLQRIYVFPNLELVVTLTQNHYPSMPEGNKLSLQLLEDILGAIKN